MATTIYNKIFNAIFYESPAPIKRALFYLPLEIKLGGKVFRETYNFIKATEYLPKDKINRIQELLLKKILIYATKKVPFYRKLGIKITKHDNALKLIRKFPIIDKEYIQEHFNQFISKDIDSRKVYYTSTGGTSGKQFKFYINKEAFAKEWAFMITQWERAGYKIGDKIATFRGVKIKGIKKGIYWQEQPLYNALEMSPFHLNYNTAKKYITKLIEWKPAFLHGYPSAITTLAKMIKELNMEDKIPKIKGILLTSENIYPWQRKILQQTFKTRVFTWYGMTEKTVLAGECEYSTQYHIFPQYSYVEIIDNQDEHVNPGEEGEIIGTSFLNTIMPFIRYRTGDIAELSAQQHCKCKRNYPLITNVKGRWKLENLVIGKNSLISLAALNIHTDAFEHCETVQLYQDTPGKLVIKLKPIPGKFSSKDLVKIKKSFEDRIGDELDIEIDTSNDIIFTPTGKLPFFIQKLDIEMYMKRYLRLP